MPLTSDVARNSLRPYSTRPDALSTLERPPAQLTSLLPPRGHVLLVRLLVLWIFKNSNWSAAKLDASRTCLLSAMPPTAPKPTALKSPSTAPSPLVLLSPCSSTRLDDLQTCFGQVERRGSWYVEQTAHIHARSALSSTCQAAAAAVLVRFLRPSLTSVFSRPSLTPRAG